MGKKRTWPFQDLVLHNRRGETWLPVPGFDDEYEVSSHGRIKSLRRWRQAGNSGYYTTERIRRQGVSLSPNQVKGDYTYCLNIGLKSPGKNISRSTSRYVYHTFVAPFDLDDPDYIITYKDGDGRNLHFSNLMLTNRSGQMTTAFQRKRARSHFEDRRLPVTMLTLDGKKVASYPSITAANKKTGFALAAIASCLDGKLF